MFDSLGCTPLSEFLEGDAVREALSADTDPFQNPITPQLVQNQMGSQFTRLGETGGWTFMNGREISLFQSCIHVSFKGNVSIIVSFGSSTRFSWFGIMQRRKLGLVFLSVAISLVRDSL